MFKIKFIFTFSGCLLESFCLFRTLLYLSFDKNLEIPSMFNFYGIL